MSRTTRRSLYVLGRDGRLDWRTRFVRDDRATGLRDHRRDRQTAKAALKSGDGDTFPNGKRCRYSVRYGEYEL